jgi:lipid-A-disaccharide synthase-like uncharacterized protein
VRISARRLALVLVIAAVLGIAVHQALDFILGARDDGPGMGLEIGFVGNLVFILRYAVVPILLIAAGLLAVRRRPATPVEIGVLSIIGGLLGLLAIAAARESAVVVALPVLLVSVIVQTIRAPGAVPREALRREEGASSIEP